VAEGKAGAAEVVERDASVEDGRSAHLLQTILQFDEGFLLGGGGGSKPFELKNRFKVFESR
jgi:hypothetical protein